MKSEAKIKPKTNHPPPLKELQLWMKQAITQPKNVSKKNHYKTELLEWIADNPPLTASNRLDVYSKGWLLRLEESLLSDYPLIAKYLGKKNFRKLATDYFSQHPSTSFTLITTGDSLPGFLKKWKNSCNEAWLFDLSLIERACYRVFFAPESNWVNHSETLPKTKNPDKIKIQLALSAEIFKSSWSLLSVLNGKRKKPIRRKSYFIVYRHQLEERIVSLTETEYKIFKKCKNGTSLGHLVNSIDGSLLIDFLKKWSPRDCLWIK